LIFSSCASLEQTDGPTSGEPKGIDTRTCSNPAVDCLGASVIAAPAEEATSAPDATGTPVEEPAVEEPATEPAVDAVDAAEPTAAVEEPAVAAVEGEVAADAVEVAVPKAEGVETPAVDAAVPAVDAAIKEVEVRATSFRRTASLVLAWFLVRLCMLVPGEA